MDIKVNELPNLVGKFLVVQVEVDSDDEDFREVEGKCLVATSSGLVVQTKSKSELLEMGRVIDIDVIELVRRLSVRWLDHVSPAAVRQHLLDRHGLRFDLLKVMDVETAVKLHDGIDHTALGHRHGEKEKRAAGRPKKESA